jgi:hypothetical protein
MDQVSTKPIWVSIQGHARNANQFPSSFNGGGDIGTIFNGLRSTSFTYAMTGDTTIGNKGKSWLLQACSWPSWTEPLGYNPQSTTAPIPYQTGIIALSVSSAHTR